jgi:NADH:ubiquinone oxidoreductase subunit K
MTAEMMDPSQFWLFAFYSIILASIGVYTLVAGKNMIKILIGLELLTKAVTLLLIAVGYLTGRQALVQSIVITLIVVEVVAIAVAAGIIIAAQRHTESLDAGKLNELKG